MGNYVYVFGYALPEILRINMDNFDIQYYDKWLEDLYQYGKNERYPFFYKDVCLFKNSLYLVSGQNHSILELDLKSNQIYIHPIEEREGEYNTIACDGNFFWLTEQTNRILKVDPRNWKFECQEIGDNIQADYFTSSVSMEKMVYLFPNKIENIYKVNAIDFSVSVLHVAYDEEDKWHPNLGSFGYTFVKKITEKMIVALCSQDCKLYVIENDEIIRKISFCIDSETNLFYEKKLYGEKQKNSLLQEGNQAFCQMENLIHYIQSCDSQNEYQSGNIGKMIFDFQEKDLQTRE